MSPAAEGRGFGHLVFGIGLEGFLFLGAGPLIGTLILVVLSFVTGGALDVFKAVSASPFVLILGYPIIWKAALFTGVVVSVTRFVITEPRRLYGFAAVIGALASNVDIMWRSGVPAGPVAVVIIGVAGAVAASLCAWFGTRVWAWGRGAKPRLE